MKVYVLPADAHGCGHFRLIWPADVLKTMGIDVVIMPPHQNSGFLATVQKEHPDDVGRVTSIQVPQDADVFVMQRPGHPWQPQMIDIMRANGIAVVIDMDDDMSTIHPDNTAFHIYRLRSDSPLNWKHAMESCKRATFVTTSTPALQKTYAGHSRGMVLDNYVPGTYLTFPKMITGMFGWAGNIGSHPNDPQVSAPAVQRLVDEGHRFATVGNPKGVASAFRLKQEFYCTGATSLSEYALTIARTLDVGMVPLAATTFNSAKSRLKGIEMSAMGIPWVASPRAEYRRLATQSGGGLLADSPKEWYNHLKRLLGDEILRKEMGEAGKGYMMTQTYEANAWRWAEAWEQALKIQRG